LENILTNDVSSFYFTGINGNEDTQEQAQASLLAGIFVG
jgi:hypothetical protein